MKHLLNIFLLLALSSSVQAMPTHYYGELTDNGTYKGKVDINFGWIDPPFGLNTWGEHVNLWGFKGTEGQQLSIDVTSSELTTGFSLYYGDIDFSDLLYGLFDNNDDIGTAKYLTGTSLWGSSQSINDFVLKQNGFYTLVVGGKDFGGFLGYDYTLKLVRIPEPTSLILLGIGLLGLVAQRRRLQS